MHVMTLLKRKKTNSSLALRHYRPPLTMTPAPDKKVIVLDSPPNLGSISSHFPIRSKLLLSITPLSLLSWHPHGPTDSVCHNRCQIRPSEWGHIFRLLTIFCLSPKISLAENCIISMAVEKSVLFVFFSHSLCSKLLWKVVNFIIL